MCPFSLHKQGRIACFGVVNKDVSLVLVCYFPRGLGIHNQFYLISMLV